MPTCAVCGAEHPVADIVTAHIEPEDVPAVETAVRAGAGVWALDVDEYRRVAGDWPDVLADVDQLFAALRAAEE